MPEEMEKRGCQVIAYEDDVALMVKRRFLGILYDLTQGYQSLMTK